MIWTDLMPKAPGYYWQRGYGDSPGLLRVVEVAVSEVDGDGSLHAFVGGWEPGLPLTAPELAGCEWAGPIPEPNDGPRTDTN
jgi:hypothetical protein